MQSLDNGNAGLPYNGQDGRGRFLGYAVNVGDIGSGVGQQLLHAAARFARVDHAFDCSDFAAQRTPTAQLAGEIYMTDKIAIILGRLVALVDHAEGNDFVPVLLKQSC